MTTIAQSPWEVAANPPPPPAQKQEYFGELVLSADFVSLVKGIGKVPWDENTLDPNTGEPARRYTAVRVTLFPLPEMGLKWEVEREMIAEFGGWTDVTLPSLKSLGIMDLPSINGKWAHIELVENGENYTKENSDGTKKTVMKTFPKFLAVYDSEDTCRAAYLANKNGTPAPAAAAPANNGTSGERDVAYRFLKQYIQSAVNATPGDLQAIRDSLAATIAGQPLLSKHFTVDSPEVVEEIANKLG